MCAVDTNVLVRLIVRDDATQLEAVRRLQLRCACHGRKLFVSTTVLLELEWVLRSRYRLGKPEVLAALRQLMRSGNVAFEREAAVLNALAGYELSGAESADSIHAEMAALNDRSPLHTFDRNASSLAGVELLR